MKFGKEKDDLDIVIAKYLEDINSNSEHKSRMIALLKEKDYLVGTALSMVTGNIPAEVLPEVDCHVLLVTMYSILGIGELNPKHWITNEEEFEANTHKEASRMDILTFPLVIDNVLEVVEGQQWIFVSDMKFIGNLYSAKMVEYEYKTQRDPKLIKNREKFTKMPNTNAVAVNQIAKSIKSKNYTPNTITFNLSKDDVYKYKYDSNTKQLIIYEGTINILDGWHRCLAIIALLTTSDIKCNFEIRFVIYNEARAANFVKQEDIRNKIAEQHIASIDMSELSHSVTRAINEEITSDMAEKIVTNRKYITNNMGLVMFKSISDTIEQLWKLDTRTDANNLSDYLIDFFNELIGLKKLELFSEIKQHKNKNYVNHEGMFVFYLTVAKELQQFKNWKELLKDIIEGTDFSKSNSFWDDLKIITKSEPTLNRFRKNAIKDITKYIEEVFLDVREI